MLQSLFEQKPPLPFGISPAKARALFAAMQKPPTLPELQAATRRAFASSRR